MTSRPYLNYVLCVVINSDNGEAFKYDCGYMCQINDETRVERSMCQPRANLLAAAESASNSGMKQVLKVFMRAAIGTSQGAGGRQRLLGSGLP